MSVIVLHVKTMLMWCSWRLPTFVSFTVRLLFLRCRHYHLNRPTRPRYFRLLSRILSRRLRDRQIRLRPHHQRQSRQIHVRRVQCNFRSLLRRSFRDLRHRRYGRRTRRQDTPTLRPAILNPKLDIPCYGRLLCGRCRQS
jgi:hypothetical protein